MAKDPPAAGPSICAIWTNKASSLKALRKRFKRSPRRFVHAERLDRFFTRLNAAGCRYVVLRWFERLPQVETGEDIDLLVRDEDVASLKALLRRESLLDRLLGRRLVRCDVYSVSGFPRGSYRGVAYYPPDLARRIIDRAERHASGAKVPCREDHFLSLAFHALYHKGLRSGIAVADRRFRPSKRPEHDYSGKLQGLAGELGLDAEMAMDALDAELARQGWRPSLDHLERLLPDDDWARAKVKALSGDVRAEPGLTLFLVRREGLAWGLQRVVAALEEAGFVVLAQKRLTDEESMLASREIRGGNWESGPWPISGGPPVAAIAALDPEPLKPNKKLRDLHPSADNARVFLVKEAMRRAGNADRPASRRCNPVHSCDNALQAARQIRLIMPELAASIADRAAELNAERTGRATGPERPSGRGN